CTLSARTVSSRPGTLSVWSRPGPTLAWRKPGCVWRHMAPTWPSGATTAWPRSSTLRAEKFALNWEASGKSVRRFSKSAPRTLAEGNDGILGYTFTEAGTYALGVRDRDYRGGADMHYRLHLGNLPVVTSLFPLGVQRGTEADVLIDGVFLSAGTVRVKVPASA